MLTVERLREVLAYDPASGQFFWKVRTSNRIKVGDRAGVVNTEGYRVIRVDGQLYGAHRLAVLHVTGVWPTHDVDHDNRDRDDNRWANLICATRSGNCQNQGLAHGNTSGYRGVSFHRASGKWSAERVVAGVKNYLGLFPTAEAARDAWIEFSQQRGLKR